MDYPYIVNTRWYLPVLENGSAASRQFLNSITESNENFVRLILALSSKIYATTNIASISYFGETEGFKSSIAPKYSVIFKRPAFIYILNVRTIIFPWMLMLYISLSIQAIALVKFSTIASYELHIFLVCCNISLSSLYMRHRHNYRCRLPSLWSIHQKHYNLSHPRNNWMMGNTHINRSLSSPLVILKDLDAMWS